MRVVNERKEKKRKEGWMEREAGGCRGVEKRKMIKKHTQLRNPQQKYRLEDECEHKRTEMNGKNRRSQREQREQRERAVG